MQLFLDAREGGGGVSRAGLWIKYVTQSVRNYSAAIVVLKYAIGIYITLT